MENKRLVVVLARNDLSGLGVARSLGVAGYTVDVITSSPTEGRAPVIASSKYVARCVDVVSPRFNDGDDEALMTELRGYKDACKQKPVLFPTDDYTTAMMDRNRKELSEIFVMPYVDNENDCALIELMDKTVQSEYAEDAGLNTPGEWIFDLDEPTFIPDDVKFPCFVKSVESVEGVKSEEKLCLHARELEAQIDFMRELHAGRRVMAQKFLHIEDEYDMSGVCTGTEVIIPAVIKKSQIAYAQRGATVKGEVLSCDVLGDVLDKVKAMMQDTGYVGMFDLELNFAGGQFYFGEVNLRAGEPNFAYQLSGVNMPELAVKALLGEAIDPAECVATPGRVFICDSAVWNERIEGKILRSSFDRLMNGGNTKLLCRLDDPKPGEIFTDDMKKKLSRRTLENAKDLALNPRELYKTTRRCAGRTKRHAKKFVRPMVAPIKQQVTGLPQAKKENERNPESENPRILVVGRNYAQNLTMARAFGEAGFEVEVLRIFQRRVRKTNPVKKHMKPDAYSKYVKAYYVCNCRNKLHRVVNRLQSLADPDRKMLLIPTDDFVAYTVDLYYAELSRNYLIPNVGGKGGGIIGFMSKGAQKDAAIAAGLKVAGSHVVKTVTGRLELPDDIKYPCFIKPNISKNGSKTRMKRCDTREELYDTLIEYSEKRDVEFIVEDFVNIKKEYSVLGVSTKYGVYAPGFFGAEEGGQNEHLGVALIGKVLDPDDYRELIDDLCRFVASLDYEGLFDLDLVEDVDGNMYFVEMNMRYGGSGYAIVRSGVNLPGMFADYMFNGTAPDTTQKVTPNKTFVSEKIMIDEYIMSRVDADKWKEAMENVDIHFIMDEDDDQPYKHFQRFVPLATMQRVGVAVKHRNDDKFNESKADNDAAAQPADAQPADAQPADVQPVEVEAEAAPAADAQPVASDAEQQA